MQNNIATYRIFLYIKWTEVNLLTLLFVLTFIIPFYSSPSLLFLLFVLSFILVFLFLSVSSLFHLNFYILSISFTLSFFLLFVFLLFISFLILCISLPIWELKILSCSLYFPFVLFFSYFSVIHLQVATFLLILSKPCHANEYVPYSYAVIPAQCGLICSQI